ncbi:uncharacterized protein TNCV_3498891 [Trichonephila clavipes]|nr:uncharacterized protein TNCV_3498891 [Trichonephila clavipes]
MASKTSASGRYKNLHTKLTDGAYRLLSWRGNHRYPCAPNRAGTVPQIECIGGIEFPYCQSSCRLSKWEAKIRHRESFVPALLKTLEEDLKLQPVYQDSPKDALSDLSLEIKLAIPIAPNQGPQDIPQQLQLGEVVHYQPSE